MTMTDDQWIQYLAIRKLERSITQNMHDFGSEATVTLCDFTRELKKHNPKLLQEIDDLLDKMDKEKEVQHEN